MDALYDCGFALHRRLFDAVDVVSQERWVEADAVGEAGHVDFRVGEEEALHRRRLGIFVVKTFETDIHVKLRPMDSVKAKAILGALAVGSSAQRTIPQQRLATFRAILLAAVDVIAVEPYFSDFHSNTSFHLLIIISLLSSITALIRFKSFFFMLTNSRRMNELDA